MVIQSQSSAFLCWHVLWDQLSHFLSKICWEDTQCKSIASQANHMKIDQLRAIVASCSGDHFPALSERHETSHCAWTVGRTPEHSMHRMTAWMFHYRIGIHKMTFHDTRLVCWLVHERNLLANVTLKEHAWRRKLNQLKWYHPQYWFHIHPYIIYCIIFVYCILSAQKKKEWGDSVGPLKEFVTSPALHLLKLRHTVGWNLAGKKHWDSLSHP